MPERFARVSTGGKLVPTPQGCKTDTVRDTPLPSLWVSLSPRTCELLVNFWFWVVMRTSLHVAPYENYSEREKLPSLISLLYKVKRNMFAILICFLFATRCLPVQRKTALGMRNDRARHRRQRIACACAPVPKTHQVGLVYWEAKVLPNWKLRLWRHIDAAAWLSTLVTAVNLWRHELWRHVGPLVGYTYSLLRLSV